MESQIYDTAEDVEYKKAVRAFFLIYNSLWEKRALKWSRSFDLKGGQIKVWEYKNNGEIKLICFVKAENSTDCYRMAADQLKWEADKESPRIGSAGSL